LDCVTPLYQLKQIEGILKLLNTKIMNIRNQVQLIGHVGATPEVKILDSNKTLAKFSFATNDSYKNAQGEWVKDTEWHQIVAWGITAQNVEKVLAKGSEVVLKGKLATRSWEDAEGMKRYTTEVILSEFTLVGSKTATL